MSEPRTKAGLDLLRTADQFGAHGTLGGYVALSKWIEAIEAEAERSAGAAPPDVDPDRFVEAVAEALSDESWQDPRVEAPLPLLFGDSILYHYARLLDAAPSPEGSTDE